MGQVVLPGAAQVRSQTRILGVKLETSMEFDARYFNCLAFFFSCTMLCIFWAKASEEHILKRLQASLYIREVYTGRKIRMAFSSSYMSSYPLRKLNDPDRQLHRDQARKWNWKRRVEEMHVGCVKYMAGGEVSGGGGILRYFRIQSLCKNSDDLLCQFMRYRAVSFSNLNPGAQPSLWFQVL
jgi:hypothetical protein